MSNWVHAAEAGAVTAVAVALLFAIVWIVGGLLDFVDVGMWP